MKYLAILILVIFASILNESESISTLCQDTHVAKVLGFKQRKDTSEFYWLSFYKGSAINSRNFCIRLGAELVHIRNESENEYIKSLLVNETEVWTGGVHVGNNVYKWLTGFNMSYTNWLKRGGEPNGVKNGEYYISMFGKAFNNGENWGYWNDNAEASNFRALCVLRCSREF